MNMAGRGDGGGSGHAFFAVGSHQGPVQDEKQENGQHQEDQGQQCRQ